jgi:hypothetical protein
MIAAPLNDHTCLSQITDVVRELVQRRDPAFVALAEQVGTVDALVDHLQSLPQRDDTGDPADGPRADACAPSQRIRLSPVPPDPNCVERAAIFLGVAELLDPQPVRQLKTAMTSIGLHTYPVEDRWAVRLDPRIARNALLADLFQSLPLGIRFSPREAIDWVASIASERAAAEVGGLERVRAAHEAMHALLDGVVLDDRDLDDVAYTCALALQEAVHFGAAGRALIRETIRTVGARLRPAPAVHPHRPRSRNALRVGRTKIQPNWKFLGALGRVGARVGVDVGRIALHGQLASIGLTPPVLSILEHEFNREGISLGPLAPQAPSLGALALLSARSSARPKSGPAAASPGDTAAVAASSLAAAPTTRELRNAIIATPGMILGEMKITDTDIKAIGRDIRESFRRPFEREREQAEARFVREFGRIPGAGKPSSGPGDHGVGLSPDKDETGRHRRVELTAANAYLSADDDFEKIHSWMSPLPTAADMRVQSYQGEFVHQWGEFERAWQAWFAENEGLGARMWGGTRDTALDYRSRAKKWREQLLALGGVAHAPAPEMPTQPSLFSSVGSGFKSTLKTAAYVAGGVVAAALIVPPLLRRSSSSSSSP